MPLPTTQEGLDNAIAVLAQEIANRHPEDKRIDNDLVRLVALAYLAGTKLGISHTAEAMRALVHRVTSPISSLFRA